MAKSTKKKTKAKSKKRSKNDKDLEQQRKQQAKADRKQARAEKKQAKADTKNAGRTGTGTGEAALGSVQAPDQQGRPTAPERSDAGTRSSAAPERSADQVEVLKLALRDTEAKLVAAEHRLHQVQQQLEAERRALADATDPAAAEEAVVDAAVAETVAEAIVAAVVEQDQQGVVGDPTEAAATTLEEAAEAIDAALADADLVEEGLADETGAGTDSPVVAAEPGGLTPPLPHEGSEDRPNASWTLVRLRKEAERRGITGVSNLPKAALVQRLNG